PRSHSALHANVLRYFLEVARSGSIRKAAQRLFVASSAVNRQILQLEAELGTELFDRLPTGMRLNAAGGIMLPPRATSRHDFRYLSARVQTGMRLNAAGEFVLRHVRTTLHDFELLRTELDALKGERTGHVSVVAMDSLFVDFLPAAVEEFAAEVAARD